MREPQCVLLQIEEDIIKIFASCEGYNTSCKGHNCLYKEKVKKEQECEKLKEDNKNTKD
jgi:hypothetical protein